MPTDLERAVQIDAARRANSTLKRYAEALAFREGLDKADVVDLGMNSLGAAQTELENAAREVELALAAMGEAECDAVSLAQVDESVKGATVKVADLRAQIETLRPTAAAVEVQKD